ncbi:MAG: precorrin-3B C(17)-methyltransferase [Dissulfurispiraceae bacterium]|jgi:cobalt-precorrin 5A hydrolase/precorrin-3B C17-methyltransferase
MNTGNKTAFYITDNGLLLAERLRSLYPDITIIKYSAQAVRSSWGPDNGLIFIMAAGIVVRSIAPLLNDKRTDPGVVTMDEKGRFVTSLLSGHIGGANSLAAEIADFLGGQPVITTASDVNGLPSIDMWAAENDLVIEQWELLPSICTRLLNNGTLNIYIETPVKLPDVFLKTPDAQLADVCITNKKIISPSIPSLKHQLYLRPKNLILGIGCNSGTSAAEIGSAVTEVFDGHNLSFLSVRVLATIDLKAGEPGLVDFAREHKIKIVTFTPDELNKVPDIEKSEAVFRATGAYAVAEAAALSASTAGTLLVHKQKRGNVTIAISEESHGIGDSNAIAGGKIYIVGTGPGSIEHITPYAQKAIRESEAIVGYGTYLDLISELIKDKEIVSTGMTQEIDRCRTAVDLALSGKSVSVVSGGDPGIYAMAGLVLELLRAEHGPRVAVEIIPGISALNASASRLGAPLMHDFAVVSLSDRLTPWELIEKRLEAAAMADFVIVLYNPKSMGRPDHINRAQTICLRYRRAETPVGIVRAAMREDEEIIITTLGDMLNHHIDMQTTVVIGNSTTFTWNNLMITPRGYTASPRQ